MTKMVELIHTHHATIRTPEGLVYSPRSYGLERLDGTWEAWLEFVPIDAGAPTLRTARDTTQASRAALVSWALGLEGAYLEGAFARARIVTHSSRDEG